MSRSRDPDWRRIVDAASAPYRRAGRFAWHFARGKLGMDPVFHHLLSLGLIPPGARVVDIGCGQGLLASLLRCADEAGASGRWPQGWAAAPRGASYTGIELMPRDVERAQAAVGAVGTFVCGDMRQVPLPACDTVVILDVLHYATVAEQDALLARVRDALSPGGRLLLRVGDADARRGFVISQWVDRVVTRVRGHRVPPTYGRPLTAWREALRRLGFTVEPRPMSEGTPFSNVLLVAQRRPGRPPERLADAAKAGR